MIKVTGVDTFLYSEYEYNFKNGLKTKVKDPTVKIWGEYMSFDFDNMSEEQYSLFIIWLISNLSPEFLLLKNNVEKEEINEFINFLRKVMSIGIAAIISEKKEDEKENEDTEEDNIKEIIINFPFFVAKSMFYLNMELEKVLNTSFFIIKSLNTTVDTFEEKKNINNINLLFQNNALKSKEGFKVVKDTLRKKEKFVEKNTVRIIKDRGNEIKNKLLMLKKMLGG